MPSPSRSTSRTVNAAQLVSMFLAFLLVAGIGGVLSAGFVMPAVATLGAATDAGDQLFEDLPTELGSEDMSQQTVIYASDDSVLARIWAWNRIVVPLDEISENMRNAVIAVEDKRFYEHGGVDPEGIMRAAVLNLIGTSQQGGSTLTQQYVKNVLIEAGRRADDPEAIREATADTLGRKLREAKLAIALEQHRSKDEILEGYLNVAQFGPSQYGVEAASRYYFHHRAASLSVAESAMLAGITNSPGKWDPVRHPEDAENRRNTVLGLMLNQDMITQEEYDEAIDTSIDEMLNVNPASEGCSMAGSAAYFCDYVRSEILSNPIYGETRADRVQLLQTGGLQIHTTLDPEKQKDAWDALRRAIPVDDSSGISNALSTVEPGTGKILAMAQNTRYGSPTDDEPRATMVNFNGDQAHGGSRGFQTGSTFKAFVLTQWLIDGHSLNDSVNGSTGQSFPSSSWDSCVRIGGPPYEPNNLESVISGRMSVLRATEQSVNTAFVNMANQMNLCDIADTVESMGYHHATVNPGEPYTDANGNQPYGDYSMQIVPSMTLGANEVAPLTMAEAFATYASGGIHCSPIAIDSITTADGEELEVPDANCERALDERVANAMNYALNHVASPGATGEQAVLDDRPVAGKTGTANDDTAAWFVGYVPQMATAVWVGHSEGTKPMMNTTINGQYYRLVYGGRIAAPIWQDYMSHATDGMEVQDFDEPRDREIYGERVSVPSVNGMSQDDAEQALESRGFNAQTGGSSHSDSVSEGDVVSTSPSAGSEVRPGSTVTMTLSSGPEPNNDDDDEGDDNNDDDNDNRGNRNDRGGGNNDRGGGNNDDDD
ncbi:transglycosylase domain-containing protein [Ruania albidiflava]|uniref:transglycosylase domain-containing protein n=1 Tax=Ruania albidiflava TaxID=366586 RepID=UPI0023F3148E|nr:transglycosylase domain-containing protein [Ruania albidiflava]